MKFQWHSFPRSWWGYHPGETERYFRNIEAMQKQAADELEEKIREERKLNNLLKQEYEETLKAVKELEMRNPPVQTDFLMQRLERSILGIRLRAEAEVQDYGQLIAQRKEEHSRRVEAIEKQLAEYRKSLDLLLEEASQWIGKVMGLGRGAECTTLADPPKEQLTDHTGSGQPVTDPFDVQGVKVLQFTLNSMLSAAAASEPNPKKPAADQPILKAKFHRTSSGFWGDMESYLGEVPDDKAAAEHITEVIMDINTNPDPQGSAISSKPADPEAPSTAACKPAETSAACASPPAPSHALAEEIKSLQYRYIVGKAAGENLYADDGKLIIEKGGMITVGVVEESERAGRLPDLIVHMVIPGFGADRS